MDLIAAAYQQKNKLQLLGKSALHTEFPDEFELYLIALELVSSSKTEETLMYFVFPIMPNSISESEKFGNNIIKTAGGIVTLSNTTFLPISINLSGSFGRSLKYVIGTQFFNLVQGFSLKKENRADLLKKTQKALFDQNIKTGYGCCKILQDIVRESKLIDENGPRILYYHNLAFNSRYIVKPDDIVFSQEVGSSNMIWNYRLSLTAIGESSVFQMKQDYRNDSLALGGANIIQKVGSQILSQIDKLLRK